MKNILIILFISLTCNSHSQIKIGNEAVIKNDKSQKYDSTYNFPKEKLYSLVGQELYVKPLEKTLQKYGYRHFYSDIDNKKIYYPNRMRTFSESDKLSGKIYKVINIISKEKTKGDYDSYIEGMDRNYNYYIQLTDNDEILYFHYNGLLSSYPFICMGYFEKIKKENIGKIFLYKKRKFNVVYDYITGEKIELNPLEEWECSDVVLNPSNYEIDLIFKDKNGKSFSADYQNHGIYMKSAEICDTYNKLYNENYILAMNNKICIGMEDVLVILAWGIPEKINMTPNNEQWVYDDQYVYIKNGKVEYFN